MKVLRPGLLEVTPSEAMDLYVEADHLVWFDEGDDGFATIEAGPRRGWQFVVRVVADPRNA